MRLSHQDIIIQEIQKFLVTLSPYLCMHIIRLKSVKSASCGCVGWEELQIHIHMVTISLYSRGVWEAGVGGHRWSRCWGW